MGISSVAIFVAITFTPVANASKTLFLIPVPTKIGKIAIFALLIS